MSMQQTGLPEQLIRTVKDRGLLTLDENSDNPSYAERLTMVTYLIMARFSFNQIEAMYNSPEIIANTVEEHIGEMSGGDAVYHGLCDILRQAALSRTRDVFELGARIGDSLPGLIDAKSRESLQRQCCELSDLLDNAAKSYHKINFIDFFAFIPILGFPFGIIRSKRLSAADPEMEKIRGLNDALSVMLSRLEPYIDLAAFEEPTIYKGTFYDYSRPNLSTGNYISDTLSEINHLKERVRCVDELLNRIRTNE